MSDTNICSLRIIWLILNEQMSDTNICSLRIIWLILNEQMSDTNICSLRIIWNYSQWTNVWHKHLFMREVNLTHLNEQMDKNHLFMRDVNLTHLNEQMSDTNICSLRIIWLIAWTTMTQTIGSLRIIWLILNEQCLWHKHRSLRIIWLILNEQMDTDHLFIANNLTYLMNKWTQTSLCENNLTSWAWSQTDSQTSMIENPFDLSHEHNGHKHLYWSIIWLIAWTNRNKHLFIENMLTYSQWTNVWHKHLFIENNLTYSQWTMFVTQTSFIDNMLTYLINKDGHKHRLFMR